MTITGTAEFMARRIKVDLLGERARLNAGMNTSHIIRAPEERRPLCGNGIPQTNGLNSVGTSTYG